MKKSLSTFARIHWECEYEEYLRSFRDDYKVNKKRYKNIQKADLLIGNKFTFNDWCEEQENFNKRECHLMWSDTIPKGCFDY